MRVLHLDAVRGMRGGQWQVLRLIQGLTEAGIESTLLAHTDGWLFTAAQQRGLRVEPLTWMRAAQAVRQYDVVHTHDAKTHTLAAVAGGAPLVVARRVAFPIRTRWKYRRATRIIAVSEFVKKIVMESGIAADRIAVVPDGVPLLETAQGRRILTPDAGGDPLKGAALAIEAGKRAGVEVAVAAKLEADLQSAAILVYLTQTEGLGSGALLAMSAGVAVIASNIGGLREVIRHRENGLLVENEVSAVADAIRELANDVAMAHRFGEAGQRTVKERFTVEHMVRGTLAVYKEVLS